MDGSKLPRNLLDFDGWLTNFPGISAGDSICLHRRPIGSTLPLPLPAAAVAAAVAAPLAPPLPPLLLLPLCVGIGRMLGDGAAAAAAPCFLGFSFRGFLGACLFCSAEGGESGFFCRKNVEFGCQNVSGQSSLLLTQCLSVVTFLCGVFLAEDFAFLCDPLFECSMSTASGC